MTPGDLISPAPTSVDALRDDLTEAQNYVLWQIAQHKYGWGYINGVGRRSAARALERRGLITIAEWDYRCTTTCAGDRLIAARWPNSPSNLCTYERPKGGWDKP